MANMDIHDDRPYGESNIAPLFRTPKRAITRGAVE